MTSYKLHSIIIGILLIISSCTSTGTTATIPPPIPKPISTDSPIPSTPKTKLTPTSLKESKDEQIIKVLFIGNSYTFYNNLPEMFELLMLSGGYEVEIAESAFGGWSLSNHATASETLDKIASNDWDYVILQEQSVVANPEIGMGVSLKLCELASQRQ